MSGFPFREPVNAWTHCAGLLVWLPATLLLWRLCRGSRVKRLGLLVFGLSLVACYAGSTLYHGVRLPLEELDGFATVDFIGVHVLIAGTITPLALVVLRGRWRWGMLSAAWLMAAGGIGLRLASVQMSQLVSTVVYLTMGWAILPCYFKLAGALSHRRMCPALVGGVLYTVGAVFNQLHWPALWPGVFSTHELWHLFVLAGSASHFWLMLTVVVPFVPAAGVCQVQKSTEREPDPASAALVGFPIPRAGIQEG